METLILQEQTIEYRELMGMLRYNTDKQGRIGNLILTDCVITDIPESEIIMSYNQNTIDIFLGFKVFSGLLVERNIFRSTNYEKDMEQASAI